MRFPPCLTINTIPFTQCTIAIVKCDIDCATSDSTWTWAVNGEDNTGADCGGRLRARRTTDPKPPGADAHVESMDGFIPIHPWNALRQWMDSRPPMDGSHRVNGWIATNPWMDRDESIHGYARSAPLMRPSLSGPSANAIRRPRPASPPPAPHLAAKTHNRKLPAKARKLHNLAGTVPKKSVTFLSQKRHLPATAQGDGNVTEMRHFCDTFATDNPP